MEQSDHMIPRVFSLMWIVSHPESLAKQSNHTISGIFLMMWMVSHPGSIFLLLQMVYHPGQSSCCGWCPILGHGTRNCKRGTGIFRLVELIQRCIKAWCHEILVMAPEIARGVLVISANLQYNNTWCHETMVMAPEI